MTTLNDNSIKAIVAWGNQPNGNPAAADALINAAAQSPYLASQFNELFSKGGKLVVGPADEGTGALGMVATIDPTMVNDYMNRGTLQHGQRGQRHFVF
jgi:hypothetical protein